MIEIHKIARMGDIIPTLQYLDKEKVFDVIIKEHKDKRSLNANSYCWLLVTKIADKLRVSKEEVYLNMLEQFGQSDLIVLSKEIPLDRYFKYYKVITEWSNHQEVKVIRGSSTYNTNEMSILLDGIVQTAEDMEIEVLSRQELSILKGEWK